ncbi:hypothetical protein RDI58_000861 [Solanum bulbocastanum]|uniref:RNase H type-1 domain-containing protein n=1 Tax=Solanum bulbocastanum TaxID=147425 RepID=A0AAN8U1X8_SOLBU
MWELWRSRCATRYGSEKSSIDKSKRAIMHDLIGLTEQKFGKIRLQASWEFLHIVIDKPLVHTKTKIVKWNKPPDQSYKINTDGSCTGGMCGVGGVRNIEGKILVAFSIYLGEEQIIGQNVESSNMVWI